MELDSLQLASGVDVKFPSLGFTLVQPTISQIAEFGEPNYFLALSVVKMSVQSLKVKVEGMTNWGILQEVLAQKSESEVNLPELVRGFLQLFCREKVLVGPRSVILSLNGNMSNIEPDQYDSFRDLILKVAGADLLSGQEAEFNPGSKRAAEIAEKMKKARARVAAQRSAADRGECFLAKYVRFVSTATSNSLFDTLSMTIYQLNTAFQTYLAWEQYDLEVRSRLAGSQKDGKMEHWTAVAINAPSSSIETVNC